MRMILYEDTGLVEVCRWHALMEAFAEGDGGDGW